jgi:acyl-CoA-binding protein
MSEDMDFEAAQVRVKSLKQTPTSGELLELYSLYKQGTLGDVQGKRPGMLDLRGRAKYDAWESRKGMGSEAAQAAYVKLVTRLESKYGT